MDWRSSVLPRRSRWAQGGWGEVNEGCGQDDDRDGAEQGGEQGGEQGERGERGGQSGGRGRLVGSKIRKTVKVLIIGAVVVTRTYTH